MENSESRQMLSFRHGFLVVSDHSKNSNRNASLPVRLKYNMFMPCDRSKFSWPLQPDIHGARGGNLNFSTGGSHGPCVRGESLPQPLPEDFIATPKCQYAGALQNAGISTAKEILHGK